MLPHTPEVTLRTDGDPPVFDVQCPTGRSPFLLTCDHAGRAFPQRLGDMGVSAHDRSRHIAWDIGIAGVARKLSHQLDAFLIAHRYSRLVIDANRPLESPASIVRHSDGTDIPGNHQLSKADVDLRANELFHPYHDRIREELDLRAGAGRATALVSLHSFTPIIAGRTRQWHAGVLYHRDARLGHRLLDLLRADPELIVGDNEPYAASEQTDHTIIVHGERRQLPYVEIEIRQDLIADERGQAVWAERLARLLTRAHADLFPV